MGHVLTRTDPLSTATVPRVSAWLYDTAGRVKERKDALGRRFTFNYDVAGNQTSIVDANANTAGNPALGSTTLVYDRLNRLTQRSYSDGTPTVTYSYDVQGRLETMVDGTGTTTYGFDTADRMVSAVKGADTFGYTYDNAGNVLTRTVPGGANTTAAYDDAGQLATLVSTGGTHRFGYDLAGNLTEMEFPNLVKQTRSYDRASRLSSIVNTDPNPQSPYGSLSFVRDNNGNPTEINATAIGFGTGFPAEKITNTYDNFDRLTSTCYSLPAAACVAANKTVWSYDKVGNRLTEKVGAAAVSTYAYDVADQLASITGPGASSFGYNANGDLLTVTGTTSEVYTYNTARQTKTANGYSYSYDGNGNRWSVVKAGLSTSVEYWDTVGGLPVLVAEREQGNPGSFESAFFRRYTYAGSMPVRFETYETQGSPRQSRVGSNLLTDQVGSVMVVTSDAQRDVRAAFRYSPFGASRTASWSTGFDSTPRFTGQKLDGSSNYHLRARQYNPGRGSFTQTDPMPYGAGSPFEGAYIYARNNPLLMNDPTGERAALAGLGGWFGRSVVNGLARLDPVVNSNAFSTAKYGAAIMSGAGFACSGVAAAATVALTLSVAGAPGDVVTVPIAATCLQVGVYAGAASASIAATQAATNWAVANKAKKNPTATPVPAPANKPVAPTPGDATDATETGGEAADGVKLTSGGKRKIGTLEGRAASTGGCNGTVRVIVR
jgi:RHS repeat-associated protein